MALTPKRSLERAIRSRIARLAVGLSTVRLPHSSAVAVNAV